MLCDNELVGKIAGVIHELKEESEALPLIKKAFAHGATLWVEHMSLYPQIIAEARKAGMQVKSLDSKMVRRMVDEYSADPVMGQYVTYHLRERSWLSRIRHANANDLIVVHPHHAKRIVKLLNLSRTAIIYQQPLKKSWKGRLQKPLRKKKLKLLERYLKAERAKVVGSQWERRAVIQKPASFGHVRELLRKKIK